MTFTATRSTTAAPKPIRMGRFLIRHELGRGSIGVVYLGHDPVIDRPVAIKTFRHKLSFIERKRNEQQFINEARAAGRLAHSNIVTIYEAATEGESTYIAMEFLQGRELNKLLDAGHRFTADDVASITWKIADALDHAHKNGVVHRDIKPANIFLVADHQPKIVDFGIARTPNRLTDAIKADTNNTLFQDNILGTPNYMSPEQALGQSADARSDIYSLGAVMYEMLTFRKPFQAESTDKLLHMIAYKTAPEPHLLEAGVPLPLSKIVSKAMHNSPDRRYQTADDMALDIKRYLTRTRRQSERSDKSLVSMAAPTHIPDLPHAHLFWPVCSVVTAILIAAYSWLH